MFLSQILGSLRVEAVLGTDLVVFSYVMLLQLGGLPKYGHSNASNGFWGAWMLLVRPTHPCLPSCPRAKITLACLLF